MREGSFFRWRGARPAVGGIVGVEVDGGGGGEDEGEGLVVAVRLVVVEGSVDIGLGGRGGRQERREEKGRRRCD